MYMILYIMTEIRGLEILAQSYCALPCARTEIRNRHAQKSPRNPRTPPQGRGKIETEKQSAHIARKIQVGSGVTPECPP
jgi:hypothetical protein